MLLSILPEERPREEGVAEVRETRRMSEEGVGRGRVLGGKRKRKKITQYGSERETVTLWESRWERETLTNLDSSSGTSLTGRIRFLVAPVW